MNSLNFLLSLILFHSLIIVVNGLFDNEINLKCIGRKYKNVTLTAYFPDYIEGNERGFLDKKGNTLRTLQDYLDNRIHYVTLSMDNKLNITYGTEVCIPELNQHFGHRIRLQVKDFSSDLDGAGYTRAEICVRSEIDSYDFIVNRLVTLVFEQQ